MLIALSVGLILLVGYIVIRLFSIRVMREERTEMDADYDALRRK